MTTPFFTVIVPTHGRPEYLAAALASIRAQSDPDFECIVIDDASPTHAVVPSDRRFRVVRNAVNRGGTASRNIGLALARGEYVCFLDDDDVWTPDRLARGRRCLARYPVAIVGRSDLDEQCRVTGLLAEGWVTDSVADNLTPHLGQTAVRRDLALPFDEAFDAVEDVDWWLRVAERSPVAVDPAIGLLYRQHRGPRNLNGTQARILGSRLLLVKHADYFAAHPAAAAFRWKRIGLLTLRMNDRPAACQAFLTSLRIRPALRTAAHLLRSVAPRGG